MTNKALITGITGQDGSYLTEFLLNKNYEVHGIVRRTSMFNRSRIEKYFDLNNYIKGGNKKKLSDIRALNLAKTFKRGV